MTEAVYFRDWCDARQLLVLRLDATSMNIFFDYCDLSHTCFGFLLMSHSIFLMCSARRPKLPPTVNPRGPDDHKLNRDHVLASHRLLCSICMVTRNRLSRATLKQPRHDLSVYFCKPAPIWTRAYGRRSLCLEFCRVCSDLQWPCARNSVSDLRPLANLSAYRPLLDYLTPGTKPPRQRAP